MRGCAVPAAIPSPGTSCCRATSSPTGLMCRRRRSPSLATMRTPCLWPPPSAQSLSPSVLSCIMFELVNHSSPSHIITTMNPYPNMYACMPLVLVSYNELVSHSLPSYIIITMNPNPKMSARMSPVSVSYCIFYQVAITICFLNQYVLVNLRMHSDKVILATLIRLRLKVSSPTSWKLFELISTKCCLTRPITYNNP